MANIEAFGAYLPARAVSNAELARWLGCEADWILQASGIAERRYAAEDEDVVDLAARAAEACLARAGRRAADVGCLIVASATGRRRIPGPAALVAVRLGIGEAPALDVPAASAGGLIAMALGNLLAPAYGMVLIVAAEKMSTLVRREPPDRNVAILFGDGAGACLLQAEGGRARIVDHVLHSDGAFADSLAVGADGALAMDGRTVILQASRKLPRTITEVLDRNSVPAADVSAFLLHQANQNLLDGVARALQVPAGRLFSNVRAYGNTSSASLLIAAAEWEEREGFRSGAPVVFAAFGAGFHWGALLAVGI
ncbi:MAG TPA: ketoacyl-ACP synthase III [Bryobacteraceae bacterium]|jgi:3-oxoacyl-[acyl-carrier-protein] synthase-3